MRRQPRVAVIGHVEWVTFAFGSVPEVGGIEHLADPYALPAGGAAISAVQLARLGARTSFYTALADDGHADAAHAFLGAEGIALRAAPRTGAQTEALTILDPTGERTIMVVGDNLQPSARDDLGWDELATLDAVLFLGDDVETLRAARAARALVVSARRLPVLRAAGILADVLVGSREDRNEAIADADRALARVVVQTAGAEGGSWSAGSEQGRYAAVEPRAPVVDSFGAGDCFLAGVTYGLAAGLPLPEALGIGARCGAAALTGRGAYGGVRNVLDDG